MQEADVNETPTVWIAVSSSFKGSDHQAGGLLVVERMDKLLDGTREEFEQWISDTIGSDFRWCVRPRDTTENREMVASLVLEDIKRSEGIFPEKNTFIERI